jgi:hypothetical protein
MDHDPKTKRSAVMIVEFGIDHTVWWTNTHQILRYVTKLCEDADKHITLDQPILLAIITVNKPETTSKYSSTTGSTMNEFGITFCDSTATNIIDRDTRQIGPITEDNQETNDNTNISNSGAKVPLVRFGVFLCIPRHSSGDNTYRIALLWRTETSDMKHASIQFGKLLYAAQFCALLREQLDEKFMKSCTGSSETALYQYLGPNCCRIGQSVSKVQFFC